MILPTSSYQVTPRFGAKRTGKTTLLTTLKHTIAKKILFVNCQDLTAQEMLSSRRSDVLARFLAGYDRRRGNCRQCRRLGI
jgi:hypothetical protein